MTRLLLAAVVAVSSGLYRLWCEKYKAAKDGAFCPFVDLGEPLLVAAPVIASADAEADELLEAAKVAESYLAQQYDEYGDPEFIPVALVRLRAAISAESEADSE